MKGLLISLLLLPILPRIALAQCVPGPATGSPFIRCYDDGYVSIDITGNQSGRTWNWGYSNASQLQDGFLVFRHSSDLNPHTVQLITDIYALDGIVPPPAPYAGTESGPGPLISDVPVSRATITIARPKLHLLHTPTNNVIILWPSAPHDWALQQSKSLDTNHWDTLPIIPILDGTNMKVTLPSVAGNCFYRLQLALH